MLTTSHARSPHPLCTHYTGPFACPLAHQALSDLSTSKHSSLCLNCFSLTHCQMGFFSLKGLKLNVTFYLVTHFVTKLFSSYFFLKNHNICLSVCLFRYACVSVSVCIYIYMHISFTCIYICTCKRFTHVCGCQRVIYRSWFSPSTFWIPGIKLRPLVLVASTFTGGASFSVLSFFFK